MAHLVAGLHGLLPRFSRGSRSRGFVAALLLATMVAAAAAISSSGPLMAAGGLVAVGPISPTDGFPIWYRDVNGLTLQRCLVANDPLCTLLAEPGFDPALPMVFPTNYPSENFWMLGSATMDTNGGGGAILVLALEAAFGTGSPAAGAQISFGRVRIWVDNLVPGATYRVTHPYGVDTFTTDPAVPSGVRNIRYVEDIGIGSPGVFTGALNSRIGPFLTWDPAVAPAAPAGYVGDPGILHPVTGAVAPAANVFRIEGPGVGAPGSPFLCNPAGLNPLDCVQTNQFSLQGKISTIAGVDVVRATYSRPTAAGGSVDVFAGTLANQALQVSGPGFLTTALRGQAGQYFGRVAFTGALPSPITVTNTGDIPPSPISVVPVDQVSISQAVYDVAAGSLTVAAASSDLGTPPTLTATGYGPLVAGSLVVPNVLVPPPTVTVTSSAGGSATLMVTVTGGGLAPLPVAAVAGPNRSVQQGQVVTLDGTGSTGPITGYTWAQTAGTPVTLTGANTATATFPAPAVAGDLVFTLTVTGSGGPSTATVTITVLPVTPTVANAGPDQTVPQGSLVTLDGRASVGATTFAWIQIGTPAVALTGANTATPTFTFPNQAVTLTFQLTVTGPGGTVTDTVVVSAAANTIAFTRAEFRAGGEWIVSGTSTINTANTVITIYVGNAAAGTVVGTAPVDALGAWVFKARGSTVAPDATGNVTAASNRGGQATTALRIK